MINFGHFPTLALSYLITAMLMVTIPVIAQDVTISPDSFNFGDVAIGSDGRPDINIPLTVYNSSESDVTLSISSEVEDEKSRFELVIPEVAEVRAAIRLINDAAGQFLQDHMEDPRDLEELYSGEYSMPDSSIYEQWGIRLIGSDPITQIEATSTDQFPDGADNWVIFDTETHRFFSYGPLSEFTVDAEDSTQLVASIMPDSTGEIQGQVSFERLNHDSIQHSITADAYVPQFLTLSTDVINFHETRIRDRNRRSFRINNTSGAFISVDFDLSEESLFSINNVYIEDVQNVLLDIEESIELYRQDYGNDPSHIQQLTNLGYLQIEEEIDDLWSFSLTGSDPVSRIDAISDLRYTRGGGHMVFYNIESKTFTGFGDRTETHLGKDREGTYFITFLPDTLGNFEEVIRLEARVDVRGLETQVFELTLTGIGALSAPPVTDLQPSALMLFPAYPNPFNSTTRISYNIPAPGVATLKLFDVAGREVSMLVSRYHRSGSQNYTLNAVNLPTGSYFLTLESGNVVRLQKLTLIK